MIFSIRAKQKAHKVTTYRAVLPSLINFLTEGTINTAINLANSSIGPAYIPDIVNKSIIGFLAIGALNLNIHQPISSS